MGPPRTRIVDGEIVREDEIGTSQASHKQPSQTSNAASPRQPHRPQHGNAAFDFSAQPVALEREPPEQSLFGMPGLRVFGAHYQSKHLAALLAATLFLGFKGFLIGNAVWVVYKLSQPQGDRRPPAAAGGQQGAGFQLPAFLQQGGIGQAAAPTSGPTAQPGSRPRFGQLGGQQGGVWGDAGGSGSAAATGRDAWAGKGPGHKLGSSNT